MAYFDWSCKKNILIKGHDGRLLPMSEPYYEARQIYPGTWQILSSGDFSYLLAGDGQALLIDSGYGAGNIREYCEQLCGMPVPWIANTHDHFDHTANNGYFDLVYMDEKSYPKATNPFESFEGVEFPKDYKVQFVRTGDVIDLPGRPIRVFELTDHAVGSLCFLDVYSHILFSGDEVWYSKPLKGDPAKFAAQIGRIEEYRNDFDILYAGNGQYGADVLDKLMMCCLRAAGGDMGTEPPKELGLLGHWQEVLEDGTIVYDRMRPHMGDGQKNHVGEKQPKVKRCIEIGGVRLIFDPEQVK